MSALTKADSLIKQATELLLARKQQGTSVGHSKRSTQLRSYLTHNTSELQPC
jgi:hypothetical protein